MVALTITIPLSLNNSRSFNTSSPTSPTVLPSTKISSTFTDSFLSINFPSINVAICPFSFNKSFLHSFPLEEQLSHFLLDDDILQ